MPEIPFVSVIIPVKNSAVIIRSCLDSVLALNYPRFEVIVVDNDSNDGTANIISEYPVKLVIETESGAYQARNKGISQAQGEIITFTDADCIVDKNWLTEIVSCFNNDEVGGAGGNLLPVKPKKEVEEFLSFGKLRLYDYRRKSVIKSNEQRFLSGALGSANMAFRSSVLKVLSGFDPELKYFGGDYDLSWRVQMLGFKLIYNPRAVVHHRMRSTASSMIRQFYYFGKGLPLLLKKQPGRFSYFQIKTYFFHILEFRLKLPIQVLMTLDLLYLFLIFLIISCFVPGLFFISWILGGLGFWGTLGSSIKIVKVTGKLKWLLLFPYYHFLRIIAFSAGKFVGGLKNGIFSI